MYANGNKTLMEQIELAKEFQKLSLEEREKEIKRQTFEKLRVVEMERRERVERQLREEREEEEEKEKRERREGERCLQEKLMKWAQRREEEEKTAEDLRIQQREAQEQLEKERLLWLKIGKLEENPWYNSRAEKEQEQGNLEVEDIGEDPWDTRRTQEEEQQERRRKAGSRHRPKKGRRSHADTPNVKRNTRKDPGIKQTLYDNWVGEKLGTDSTMNKAKEDPMEATYVLFVPKESSASAGMYHFTNLTFESVELFLSDLIYGR